jgi:hypothetical protein
VKASLKLVENFRDTGSEVLVITLHPETEADVAIAGAVRVGVPPEGNIIGWLDCTKIVLEAGEK